MFDASVSETSAQRWPLATAWLDRANNVCHIEGDADDRQEPDDGKHDGLLADGLVVAVSAERDAPLARARARALVHHEDAVQGHGSHHGKEHEQDDADGDRAGTRQIRLGDAVQIIRIIDLEHAAVQRLAIEPGMEEVAVLKLRDVKPRLKGVGTNHGGIGAVRDQVILCRNRHDVAVAPDGHILEHTGGRAWCHRQVRAARRGCSR